MDPFLLLGIGKAHTVENGLGYQNKEIWLHLRYEDCIFSGFCHFEFDNFLALICIVSPVAELLPTCITPNENVFTKLRHRPRVFGFLVSYPHWLPPRLFCHLER